MINSPLRIPTIELGRAGRLGEDPGDRLLSVIAMLGRLCDVRLCVCFFQVGVVIYAKI